jgi:hypothetical protein
MARRTLDGEFGTCKCHHFIGEEIERLAWQIHVLDRKK